MANDTDHSERFEELCAGYVLNALEPGEQAAFERMLESANQEQMELCRKLQSAAGNLAFNVDKIEPPEAVKQQLLQVINEDLEETEYAGGLQEDDSGSFDKTTFAIAASFALLVVSLSLIFYSFNLSSQLQAKNERIGEQENQITVLKEEIERKDELLSILESREVNMVIMKGMEASPNGYGKIIWDAGNQKALLQVSNLPPVPADKEYQLWIIKDNQPISAGLFAVHDPGRDAFFKIEQMEPADDQTMEAFAVTLEPKGGMPEPTGDMYLMGNME